MSKPARIAEDGRECTRCRRFQPWAEFYHHATGARQKQSHCRTCNKGKCIVYMREYRAAGAYEQPKEVGMTYEEIGQAMGISKQAVQQLEQRAIRKLRNNPRTMRMIQALLSGRF